MPSNYPSRTLSFRPTSTRLCLQCTSSTSSSPPLCPQAVMSIKSLTNDSKGHLHLPFLGAEECLSSFTCAGCRGAAERERTLDTNFDQEEGPVKELTFGAQVSDDVQDDKGKVDYYAVVHRISEKVSRQPSDSRRRSAQGLSTHGPATDGQSLHQQAYRYPCRKMVSKDILASKPPLTCV